MTLVKKVILLIGILIGTFLWSNDTHARKTNKLYPQVLTVVYFCSLPSPDVEHNFRKCELIEFMEEYVRTGVLGRHMCHDLMNDVVGYCPMIPDVKNF